MCEIDFMFLNKSATVYSPSYDSNRIQTRTSSGTTTCKLSPFTWDTTGLQWIDWYEIFNLYTRDQTLTTKKKVVIDSITYYVVQTLEHDWTLTSYARYIVKRAKWD